MEDDTEALIGDAGVLWPLPHQDLTLSEIEGCQAAVLRLDAGDRVLPDLGASNYDEHEEYEL
jgi:hypothetical protein